jgi:two-component system response regulator NreC
LGKRSLTPKVSEIVLEGFLKAKGRGQAPEHVDAQPTPRELQIIRLLAGGKVNKEIAYQLGITVRTVEAHRAHVMQKLGLHSLADLIHYALRHGIASAPVPAPKDPPSL